MSDNKIFYEVKTPISESQLDENHVIAERREKLKAIREAAKTNGNAAFEHHTACYRC